MSSLNQVSLIGNVGKKPELRFASSGYAVARFSVATDDSWIDKAGERQQRTQWHRIVAWGGLADTISEHLDGGRQVHVQGVLRTRDWTDAKGVKRSTTEVYATRVLFLGGKPLASKSDEPLEPPAEQGAETSISDDEIPF
jgi:single-strand DNA-binding protein